MIFLVLLSSLWAQAKVEVRHPKTQSIVWAFTSIGDKSPSIHTNFVNNKHELFRLYYKNLSDYNHSVFSGTVPRIEHELKVRKLVCYPGSSDADRRKAFAYLTPQYIQPSPKLVTRKEIAAKLTKNGEISVALKDIIKKTDLKGIVTESRSYGPSIDKVLTEKPNNLRAPLRETFGTSILQMIANKKIDYTVEYDFFIKLQQGENNQHKDIVELSLSDMDPSIIQYLACSKTPEGLAVVKRADQVIRDNIQNPSYWKGVLDSIPENERGLYQKEIDKYISERMKAPIIIE